MATKRTWKQIYLDHNSTSYLIHKTELGEHQMLPRLFDFYGLAPDTSLGNVSSVHWGGREGKRVLDQARENLAQKIGCMDSEEILFTSSATESINTALKGFFFQNQIQGKESHFVSTAVEHEATLETLKFLEKVGAKVWILKVDPQGQIDLSDLKKILQDRPATTNVLVSMMAANNETGVIFPWREAAAITQELGGVFHLDSTQALGKISDFSLLDSAVSLASFSAHKMGGPTGVGALVVKRGVKLDSILHGGAQERKRRAGTIHLRGIMEFGFAAHLLGQRNFAGMKQLRDSLESKVSQNIPGVLFQGGSSPRICNTSNMIFDSVRGEGLLMALDLEGFAVSSGSACSSGSIQPSHVLLAMGMDRVAAQSAIRVSLGPETTEEEIELFLEALTRNIARIRKPKA